MMTNRPPLAGLMAGWPAGPAPGWGGAQRFPMGFPAGPPPPLGFGFLPPPIRFLPTPLQRLPHHPQPFISRPHQSNSPKSANFDAAVSDSEPTKTDAAEAVSASSKPNPCSSSSRSSPNKPAAVLWSPCRVLYRLTPSVRPKRRRQMDLLRHVFHSPARSSINCNNG